MIVLLTLIEEYERAKAKLDFLVTVLSQNCSYHATPCVYIIILFKKSIVYQ